MLATSVPWICLQGNFYQGEVMSPYAVMREDGKLLRGRFPSLEAAEAKAKELSKKKGEVYFAIIV